MNPSFARQVIEKLLRFGVREFCVCAGARNAPLVAQLAHTEGARIFSFFEERSAAFFALGRIRATHRPVAVIMTSGTAVAECLPAVIEAQYQGLPLVIVSADRPRSYRGTGAPQSIDQVGIFASSVESCIDVAAGEEDWDLSPWSLRRAIHLNACFDEPKPTETYEKLEFDSASPEWNLYRAEQPLSSERSISLAPGASERGDVPKLENPVAILGPLRDDEKPAVAAFLEKNRIPFVAEAPAALDLPPPIRERRILCQDKTLSRGFERGTFKSVLRLGGVPTLRFWRDLEEKFKSVPVHSFSSLAFSGLARGSSHRSDFRALARAEIAWEGESWNPDEDREAFARLETLFAKYPRAEASLVRKFAEASHADSVYLGNSLPIREWDQVAADLSAPSVWANRGANGIDGQISSFLGWTAGAGKPAWALVGDLTALYDLAALWASPQLETRPRRLVVLNNFGGQIFRPMFSRQSFLNQHEIGFRKWAEMWNWDYAGSGDGAVFSGALSDRQVIELLPDQAASDLFNQEWKAT